MVLGAVEGNLMVLAARGVAEQPGARPGRAVIAKAWRRRELVLVKRPSPEANPFLAALMPDAGNLLVSPMIADGRRRRDRCRASLAHGLRHRASGRIGLGQFSAVAALNLRNAALLRHVQDLAERDSLTGAANRRMFQHTLERTLAANDSLRGERMAVLFIDLDDFKVINDTLGHAAGDSLLIAVTDRISSLVRQDDLVARLGGDEFADPDR